MLFQPGLGGHGWRVPGNAARAEQKRDAVIILGIVLLIIGFVLKVALVWTLGIIALIVGVVLFILGAVGREVGGRKHYF